MYSFDCKDKYWYKRLAYNWNEGKGGLSYAGRSAITDCNGAIPPQKLMPNEKRIRWIAVALLTHVKVSRVILKYHIVTVT